MKYHIVTFGCAANEADSERIRGYYESRGYSYTATIGQADDVIINTCMIREKAAHRVYGLVHNLSKEKLKRNNSSLKIIVTGCMVGMAHRDTSGRLLRELKKKLPAVDEFLPIEEVGFDTTPIRADNHHALVLISNGCNNFCTYCVVPFARGREISRPFQDIINECKRLVEVGYTQITLVGQNVNSYGSDLIIDNKSQTQRDISSGTYFKKDGHIMVDGKKIKPVYVKHLGRLRIPTLFPELLQEVANIKGIKEVDFISSNPWDFSDELIDTIACNPTISRHIHLPVQSGDREILKKMNRWYTPEEYITLIKKLHDNIPNVTISTDIIVGFCGETEEQFLHTVELCKKVGFTKAYVAMYSDRPMTAAHKTYNDTVTYSEKKRRWKILEDLINKTNLQRGTYQ